MPVPTSRFRRQYFHVVLAALSTTFVAGCAADRRRIRKRAAQIIDAAADEAWPDSTRSGPRPAKSRRRPARSWSFPRCRRPGLIIGGSYGEGVLKVGKRSTGHYVMRSGALGIVAGAEKRSLFRSLHERRGSREVS